MGTVYVFFADGFEEIEAFTSVDVMRRAGLNVEIAEKLQISKKTVENHLNLALKELKNALLFFIFLYLC